MVKYDKSKMEDFIETDREYVYYTYSLTRIDSILVLLMAFSLSRFEMNISNYIKLFTSRFLECL